MPIGNITQTISELPASGRRGVDVQTQFVIKQEDFQDHLQGVTVTELNTLKNQLNSRIGEINATTTTMDGYANTASAGASTATTKAGEASTSASAALTSRNQAETFAQQAQDSALSVNVNNLVKRTGAETIAGVKTFSSNIVGNITGNAGSATKLTNSSGDWSGSGAIANVVGMLSWKHFGNNHTIFDASNGTAPNGMAVNNTNPTSSWAPSYPTLMGWNGGITYGVRVDSARVADSISKSGVETAIAGCIVGEIGTYAFLSNVNATSIEAGGLYAGSDLRYAGISASLLNSQQGNLYITAADAPTGTWRAMGHSYLYAPYKPATLFLRIA